jgi:DNA mismatch endonuclease (patch repair protein)
MTTTPKTRQGFWDKKFKGNKARDLSVAIQLHSSGWKVLTIWECALKGKSKRGIDVVTNLIVEWLLGDDSNGKIPL